MSHIDKRKQLEKGQQIALASMLLILALALLKAVVGYRFESPLLVADAWHSGADVFINLSSLIGLKFAAKKKSKKFPYGLYRAETMACFLIGVVIVFVGVDMVKEGWHKLFLMDAHQGFPLFPMAASLVSCGVASVLAVKQRAIGNAIGSQALLATSKEAFFDIFTSLFVLFGIIFVYAKIPYVEGVIICLIATLIVKLGVETAWKSMLILMDADMDADLKVEIEKKLNRIQGVKDIAGVKIRQAGPFKIVSCIIKTTPSQTVYKSHELADLAENILLETYENIESVFVHVEPEKERLETAVIPVQDKNGLESRLHHEFAKAPYYIVVTLKNNQVGIDSCMSNSFLENKGHVGLNVAKSIVDSGINLLFVSKIGEISFHYLKNHYVDIFKIDGEMTVKQIVQLYKNNKLDAISRPGPAKRSF